MEQTQSKPDINKATRMARALLAEGYSTAHVEKALHEKGHTAQEVARILHRAGMEVLNEKRKQNRNALFIVGSFIPLLLAWYYLSDQAVEGPNWILLRALPAVIVVTLGLLVRQIILWVKLANMENQKI